MLLDLSGRIMYNTLESTNEVVEVMLGGELYTSVVLI
jgi:hypothetical protein